MSHRTPTAYSMRAFSTRAFGQHLWKEVLALFGKLLLLIIAGLLLTPTEPGNAQSQDGCYDGNQQEIPCPLRHSTAPNDGRINNDVVVNSYGAVAIYCIDASGKPASTYSDGEIRVLNQSGQIVLSASAKAINSSIAPLSLLASNQPISPDKLSSVESYLENLETQADRLRDYLRPNLNITGPVPIAGSTAFRIFPAPSDVELALAAISVGDHLPDPILFGPSPYGAPYPEYLSMGDPNVSILDIYRLEDAMNALIIVQEDMDDTIGNVLDSDGYTTNIHNDVHNLGLLVNDSALVPENGITAAQRTRFEIVDTNLHETYTDMLRALDHINEYREVLVNYQPVVDLLRRTADALGETDVAKRVLSSSALKPVQDDMDMLDMLLNRQYVHSDSERDFVLVEATPIYSLFVSSPVDFVLTSIPDAEGKSLYYHWHGCG